MDWASGGRASNADVSSASGSAGRRRALRERPHCLRSMPRSSSPRSGHPQLLRLPLSFSISTRGWSKQWQGTMSHRKASLPALPHAGRLGSSSASSDAMGRRAASRAAMPPPACMPVPTPDRLTPLGRREASRGAGHGAARPGRSMRPVAALWGRRCHPSPPPSLPCRCLPSLLYSRSPVCSAPPCVHATLLCWRSLSTPGEGGRGRRGSRLRGACCCAAGRRCRRANCARAGLRRLAPSPCCCCAAQNGPYLPEY